MLCFAIGAVGLILTLSRGGWISVVVSFVVMIILSTRNRLLPLRKVVAMSLIVLFVSVIFMNIIISRFEDPLAKKSGQSRLPLINVSIQFITEHPVVGVGLNNYYRMIVDKNYDVWSYLVHSKYLLIWAETGTIGIFFFVWFLIGVIRSGIRATKGRDLASVVSTCICAGLIGHAVHMSVDVFDGVQIESYLWFIAGFIVSLDRYQVATRTSGSVVANDDIHPVLLRGVAGPESLT
jgi:O-antigen ligase